MMELFFFDIETAGNYPDYKTFQSNDFTGSSLFKKKHDKMWSDRDINQSYIENSGIISTYGKIVCISYGFIENNGKIFIKSLVGEEYDIINKFNKVLEKVQSKNFNVSGYRILYFDIPWFLHKCHKYSIDPVDIILSYNKKPWEMRITDISEDWKGKFAWSYSFDEVVYELGIQSPKDKMDGSDVHIKYWNGDIDDIREYCEKDILACIEVSNKMY